MINHKWSKEDEYNISKCERCGLLRGRKANTTYTLTLNPNAKTKGRWYYMYSKGGTKWNHDNPECDNPLANDT